MKTYKEELKEFVEIYEYIDGAEKLLLNSDIGRDEAFKMLYDKAFSEKVNRRLQDIFPFDWYDPDEGYDDGYIAWKNVLDDVVEKVKKMIENGN